MNLHFFEWLAAVLIYQSFGYLSLQEQNEFKVQERKRAIVQALLTPDLFVLVTNHKDAFSGVQSPDLLVYAPDRSDWFLCEVKGPTDRLRPTQASYFDALSAATKKDIRIVRFRASV